MSEKAGKAKDKAFYALGNLSTVMGRTTHKLMAKMGNFSVFCGFFLTVSCVIGKAEVTQDMPYNTQRDGNVMASKKLKQLATHVEKLGELLHTMMVVQGIVFRVVF